MPSQLLPVGERWYSFLPWVVVAILIWRGHGWRRAAAVLLGGWAIAFAAEWASTSGPGIPFGVYHYRPSGLRHDWVILGVPLFDSISFTWLAFCAYEVLGALGARGYRRLLLGAIVMVGIDMVVDPVALRGARWFLGSIYSYPAGTGAWFGVSLLNYVGWLVVGLALQIWLWLWLPDSTAGWSLSARVGGILLGAVLLQSIALAVVLGVAPAAPAAAVVLLAAGAIAWSGHSAPLPATALILACALSSEARAARAGVPGRWERVPGSGVSRWVNRAAGVEVWVTGMGPAAAGRAAARAPAGCTVLVAGVAGACRGGWNLGAAGVGEAVVGPDLGHLDLNRGLAARLTRAGVGRACVLATVEQIADQPEDRQRLTDLGVDLVEMETASWAVRPQLLVAAVRVVLDTPEQPLGAVAGLLQLGGSGPSLLAVARLLLRHPGRLRQLIAVGGRQRQAMNALSEAVGRAVACLGPGLQSLPGSDSDLTTSRVDQPGLT